MSKTTHETLDGHLTQLRLPTIKHHYHEYSTIAVEHEQPYDEYLLSLIDKECEVRAQNKIAPKGLKLSQDFPLVHWPQRSS